MAFGQPPDSCPGVLLRAHAGKPDVFAPRPAAHGLLSNRPQNGAWSRLSPRRLLRCIVGRDRLFAVLLVVRLALPAALHIEDKRAESRDPEDSLYDCLIHCVISSFKLFAKVLHHREEIREKP
jgi:hypothetical protein